MIIDLPRFLASQRPTWQELEQTLARLAAEPDFRFDYAGAQRFHYLYQKVSADLARLGPAAAEPQLRQYLEALVAQAYIEIHGTRETGQRWRFGHWLLRLFPEAFRRRGRAFVVSVLVTLVGVAFGGFAVGLDPEAKEALVPPQFSHLLGDPAQHVREEEQAKEDRLEGQHASFASSLMANNIRVAILAMALGMSAGVGTLVLLFYNGVILGVVVIDFVRAGQEVFLLGWLLPHGVIEIPAILIAGQAGLVLGAALLGGGGERSPLAARLRAVGPDVMTLIGGVAVMLVWAGLVESFLSQHHQPVLPYALKIGFGVAEALLLAWWLGAKKGERASAIPAATP